MQFFTQVPFLYLKEEAIYSSVPQRFRGNFKKRHDVAALDESSVMAMTVLPTPLTSEQASKAVSQQPFHTMK